MEDDTKEFPNPKHIQTPYEPLAQPKANLIQRGLQAIGLQKRRNGAIWKDANGYRQMLIITSNAYQDREGETIKETALKEWVDKQWLDGKYIGTNPLLFWHDNRVKMGEIIFSDMQDTFLVEIAKETDGLLATKLWDYAEANNDGGASHGFWGWSDDADDTLLAHIDKEETSYLPREAAANELTYAGVLPMERSEVFNKAVGLDNADALLEEGMGILMEALKKQGVQSKSLKKNSANDARAKLELVKSLGQLAMEEGVMKDKTKAAKFEDLMNRYAKVFGDEEKAEGEIPEDEEKEEEEIVIEEETKELVIEDVRALLEEYLAPLQEAIAMLMDGAIATEAAKSKSRQAPRMAKRASRDDDTIVEIDLKGSDVPQSIKEWSNPTEDFFGHKIARR